MIRISWGCTRIVIVIGPYALKIAKVQIERALRRIAYFAILPYEQKQIMLRKKARGSYRLALLRVLRLGTLANRMEYRYYHNRGDTRVMPTYHIFFKGIIILQEGGDPITREEFQREHPLPCYADNKKIDLHHPGQFSRSRKTGRVLISDYGHPGTLKVLSATCA